MGTVVEFGNQSSAVGVFPGAMIASANGARKRLLMTSNGFNAVLLYPKSGSPPPNGFGINLNPITGAVELNSNDDPDLVVAEWWAYSFAGPPLAGVMVMEEVET